MAKTTLKVTTPAGEFTRTTDTAYTHAVVRTSKRAKDYVERVAAGKKPITSGVFARFLKDQGHIVTWHQSESAAQKAAAGENKWDRETTLIGVFSASVA
ncbi:MAG TPA: hypothetical protein VF797_21645 [Noviherbaspirillum sp.]